MPAFCVNEKPHLNFGEEGLVLPKVRSSVEFQTPDHFAVIVFCEIGEDLLERRSSFTVPFVDTSIG